MCVLEYSSMGRLTAWLSSWIRSSSWKKSLQNIIFNLHGRKSNFCLKFDFPHDRAASYENHKTSSTLQTVGCLSICSVLEAGKVNMRLTINMNVVGGFHDKAFVSGGFKILANVFEYGHVLFCGAEGLSGTLMDCKGNVRLSVTRQIEEHFNNTGVVDIRVDWLSFESFRRGVILAWVSVLKV